MTLSINNLNASPEIWTCIEKEKQFRELTIRGCHISEATLQKLQEIAPQRLIFINTHITKVVLEPLINLRLQDLTFVDCTLKDTDAELLAFSGAKEKVVFKRCLLTDLIQGNSTDTETISLGIIKTDEEIAVVNPDLTDLAQKTSEISEELLLKIDVPDRYLSVEQVDYSSLVDKEREIARSLISVARTFIEQSNSQLADLGCRNGLATIILDSLTNRLRDTAEFVEAILDHYDRSDHEKAKEGLSSANNESLNQLEVIRCANSELEKDIANCKDSCISFFTTTIG